MLMGTVGQLLRLTPHADDKLVQQNIMEEVTEMKSGIWYHSAYRSAATSLSVVQKKSQHQQDNAIIVRLSNTSVTDGTRFLHYIKIFKDSVVTSQHLMSGNLRH